MKEWQRIRRTDVPTVTRAGQGSFSAEYAFTLSDLPPAEWRAFFEQPVGIAYTPSLAPPRVQGSTVVFQATVQRLAEEVGRLDQRITQANDRYVSEVVARRRAIEERNRSEREAEDRRRAELQRAADELLPPQDQ